MARKSKELILSERLAQISECPLDIFKYVPEDEVLTLLTLCEGGDPDARLKLCQTILSACGSENVDSLEYLLSSGIERGCERCISLALRYACRVRRTPIQLAKRCVAACGESTPDALGALARIAVSEKRLTDAEVERLSLPEFAAVPLYLLPRDDCRLSGLATLADVPSILSLPSLGGEGASDSTPEGLSVYLAHARALYDPEWRDFWLRCAYEYALGYTGGIRDFAALALPLIKERDYAESHAIHVFAAAMISEAVDENTLENLRKVCEFAGHNTEKLDTGAVLREAVYLDSPRELAAARERERLGGRIIHTRNRYSLTHTLAGHTKRVKQHCWQVSLTIEGDILPTFTEARIEAVRCAPERGGITLERDPAICQIICRGEIILPESRHPFIIDLLLYMAFVSATKCASLAIIPMEFTKADGLLTMDCRVLLK